MWLWRHGLCNVGFCYTPHHVILTNLVLSVFSCTWCDCWPYHVCVFQYVIQHVSRSCVCVTVVQQYFADAAKTHYQFWWEVSCWRHSWPGWWHHGKAACQLRHGSGLYMRQYSYFVPLYNFHTRPWISPFFSLLHYFIWLTEPLYPILTVFKLHC